MNQLTLKKHLVALATLPETESPVISACFDLPRPFAGNRARLRFRATLARHSRREQQDLPVEAVGGSGTLERNRGVGFLLRYLPVPDLELLSRVS